MNHPEVLLLPVLMIADYYLTILGAVLREKEFGKHFIIDAYEMNPTYRNGIDQKRLLNLQFIAQVLLNFLILLACSIFLNGDLEFIFWIVLGFYLTLYGYVIGLHVSNILIFRWVERNPNAFDGVITLSHDFNLRMSLNLNAVLLIPVIIILIFSFSFFVLGSLLAVVYNITLVGNWIRKRKHAEK